MFDSHTIYLVGFVSQVVFALTLALLAFSDRRTRGTVWLAVCTWLQLAMTFARSVIHSERENVLLSAGSCLIVLASFFLYMGLRWFAVRRPLPSRNGPVAVSAVMLAVLAVSAFDVAAGLLAARICAIGMTAFIVPMLWRTRIVAMQQAARLSAGAVGALGVTMLYRLVLGLMPQGPYAGGLDLVGRLATTLAATAVSFTFVGLFLAESHRRLHDETRIDVLTGLRNRRSMEECVARAVNTSVQNGSPLSLLVMDVDLFKNLNDNWGHAVGDRALQALGGCLLHSLDESVITARLGGEEFGVLLPGKRMEEAADVAELLRKRVQAIRIDEGPHMASITVSIGVSSLRNGERGWIDMLRRADKALYRAKNEGRNRVSMWNERDGNRGSRQDSKLPKWRRPWTATEILPQTRKPSDARRISGETIAAEVVN